MERRKLVSTSQKKTLLSLLSINLKKLTITPPNDLEFSDVFGPSSTPHDPNHSHSPSTSSSVLDPPVIHNRSHSFVGPSPRYPLPSSPLPFHHIQEDDEAVIENESCENEKGKSEDDEGQVGSCGNNNKIGPADFEILRVVGKGAFGKVFQVRKKTGDGKEKGGGGGSGDGIYAMKVMRKDTIIKKKHVDYMKAERDILTKVVHPFIVQLRYSFQVLFHYSFFLASFFLYLEIVQVVLLNIVTFGCCAVHIFNSCMQDCLFWSNRAK
jgi:p70 ribosomal S6 kinase